MSMIDKLGIVWGCLVAFFLVLISGSAQLALNGASVSVWALLVLAPWALLRGLAWVFKDAR